ncbi:MAG: cation:proton antiporter [Candidatus Altiarchaeota archaeon]|nr:cation:proton antiporter [Candidatus Altiarchaeota archaeon]
MKKRLLLVVLVLALLPEALAASGEAENGMPIEIVLLSDIGLIIIAATVIGYTASILKQPLIPAYILAGILIGPMVSNLVTGAPFIYDFDVVVALSQLGITFLLFTVGMELDLSRLKDVGLVSAFVGIAQVAVVFWAGFLAAVAFGFGAQEALFLGLIVAFSSTMVVIKIISDRDEIETLHGRIMLGILLIQDVIVVIVMSLISAPGGLALDPVVDALVKGLGLFALAIVISRFIAPAAMRSLSKSVELIFLFALSLCFVFALASHSLGFSPAIGGFLAGLSLAVFPYNLEVSCRIKPLRDFFAIMFFVSLGMQIVVDDIGILLQLAAPIIVFSIIVLLLKPVVIALICLILGYERRTSFLAGVGLGQISEFSLILALPLALENPASPVFLITLVIAIVTISITPYLIKYGNSIYIPFSGMLEKLEKMSFIKKRHQLERFPEKKKLNDHIVFFGAHIMGMEVINHLQKSKEDFVVVDHNPEIIKKLINRGVHSLYGDAEDIEVLEKVNLKDAKLIISTIPNEDDSLLLIKTVRKVNPDAMVFVTAKTIDHAIKFYREGADYIFHLKLLGGKEAAKVLDESLGKGGKERILKRKIDEIGALERKRREEIIDRLDPTFLKQLDELKAQCEIKKSEELGEE